MELCVGIPVTIMIIAGIVVVVKDLEKENRGLIHRHGIGYPSSSWWEPDPRKKMNDDYWIKNGYAWSEKMGRWYKRKR